MSRLSVIIPTYQHAMTLSRCLDAIFLQSRLPEEIIIVDDGSTDGTRKLLDPYMDRVQYVFQKNQGAPVARNNGFHLSTGDLVIFCDADAILEPVMFEVLESALNNHPEASWAYSSFYWGQKLFRGKSFAVESLKEHNYIHTTSLIRRQDFPGFDPSLKRFQDWDLWLTMSEQGKKGIFVDQTLFQILIEKKRSAYSTWLPKLAYKIPWKKFGWEPESIRKHEMAKKIIVEKHAL
ncbi:glycosyltransferase family 2 protein [Candidatus Uhrbacteria bacterium]|nr:glycosyltransferase family 2 protein [Candidatus Uhrbacteria bacterium]